MDQHRDGPLVVPAATTGLCHRQLHRVAPAQLLLGELLPLAAADLEERVAAELEANAALELTPAPTCPRCGHPAWTGVCPPCETTGRVADRIGPPDGPARLDRVPAPVSPRGQLLADAARLLGRGDRPLAGRVLAEVDDLGLLGEPVPVLAARLGVGTDAIHRVIRALRAAGAPGLGATGIVERLRLEVAALGAVPPAVEMLVERGLDRLAHGTVEDTALACGLPAAEVRSALAWLSARIEADVFPGAAPVARPPVDVVVRRHDGRLAVEIPAGSWAGLRVAESYGLAAGDPAVDADVARARRFLDGLDRRTTTLARVAGVVAERQHHRMTEGPRAHRPLLRRDVAAELGVHESTVSRAVAGKHVLLPRGETVPFAALFGAAAGVQQCLRDLVAVEVVALSDAELVAALAGQGHRIARRTVAKYRAALGIPPQQRR